MADLTLHHLKRQRALHGASFYALSALNLLFCVLCMTDARNLNAQPTTYGRGADLECGADRRCRLERLKQQSQARKRRRLQVTDQRAREAMKLQTGREHSELPRYRHPWGVDLMAASEGFYGATGRYSFNEHWQVGLNAGVAMISDTVKQGPQISSLTPRVISLTLAEPGVSAQVEGLYMMSAQRSTPFFGLGARYIQGVATVTDSQAPLGGGGGIIGLITDLANNLAGTPTTQQIQQSGELELHLLSAKVGIDFQDLSTGLHARIALSYHYPLYGGHRDIDTGKNLATKTSVKDWATDDLTWDIELSIGWSL